MVIAYAYNDANELTTMTVDGVETYFTYDDWGWTASKFVGDGSVLHASSVIARKESSTDEAIWASASSFESRREHVSKCLPFPQIASSLEDSLFAMTITADANPAMEREWYRYDAGWNVGGGGAFFILCVLCAFA